MYTDLKVSLRNLAWDAKSLHFALLCDRLEGDQHLGCKFLLGLWEDEELGAVWANCESWYSEIVPLALDAFFDAIKCPANTRHSVDNQLESWLINPLHGFRPPTREFASLLEDLKRNSLPGTYRHAVMQYERAILDALSGHSPENSSRFDDLISIMENIHSSLASQELIPITPVKSCDTKPNQVNSLFPKWLWIALVVIVLLLGSGTAIWFIRRQRRRKNMIRTE